MFMEIQSSQKRREYQEPGRFGQFTSTSKSVFFLLIKIFEKEKETYVISMKFDNFKKKEWGGTCFFPLTSPG